MTAFLALASPPALQLLARHSAGGSAFQSAASREAAFTMGDHGCMNIWTVQSVLLCLLQTAVVADTMTQKRWSWPEEGRRCRHARHMPTTFKSYLHSYMWTHCKAAYSYLSVSQVKSPLWVWHKNIWPFPSDHCPASLFCDETLWPLHTAVSSLSNLGEACLLHTVERMLSTKEQPRNCAENGHCSALSSGHPKWFLLPVFWGQQLSIYLRRETQPWA